MEQKQTYDSALARLNEIVNRLEGEEAISVDDYKKLATEAKDLLAFCRAQLKEIEEDVESIFAEK